MQFCFSILFFVLLTFLLTYAALSRCRRPADRPPTRSDEYAAQLERLKAAEKER
jgi:hypothetical protein